MSSEYLPSIDTCNSSNIKRNACYFSPQYSQLWQVCSSIDSDAQHCTTLPNKQLLTCYIWGQKQYLRQLTTRKNTLSLTTLNFPNYYRFSSWVANLSLTWIYTEYTVVSQINWHSVTATEVFMCYVEADWKLGRKSQDQTATDGLEPQSTHQTPASSQVSATCQHRQSSTTSLTI